MFILNLKGTEHKKKKKYNTWEILKDLLIGWSILIAVLIKTNVLIMIIIGSISLLNLERFYEFIFYMYLIFNESKVTGHNMSIKTL